MALLCPWELKLQPAHLALCPRRTWASAPTATPLFCCALCVKHPLLLPHRPNITAFRDQLRRLPPPQTPTVLVLTEFFCLRLELVTHSVKAQEAPPDPRYCAGHWDREADAGRSVSTSAGCEVLERRVTPHSSPAPPASMLLMTTTSQKC